MLTTDQQVRQLRRLDAEGAPAAVAGQIVSSLILSHFGWLGSPLQHITVQKAAGAALLLVGSIIATRG